MSDRYIMICKDDDGIYRLATRTLFLTRVEAEDRMIGIAPGREPMIVTCDPNTVLLRKEEL